MIFSIALTIRIFVSYNFGSIQYDEGVHSLGGIFLSKLISNKLQNPSDFILTYPVTIDSLWFYPPLYAIFSLISFQILGYTEFAARIVNVIFSVLFIHISICIAREIDPDEKVSIVAAFLSSFSSIIIIVGSGALVDVPLAVLITYSIYYFIKGAKIEDESNYLKAGVLGGLAGLMKPIGIAPLLFAFGFQILFSVGRRELWIPKGLWKGLIAGFLIFSTWWGSALTLNYFIGGPIGQAAVQGVMYWFNVVGTNPPWFSPTWKSIDGWTYYLDNLIYTMGTLPFATALGGIIIRLWKKSKIDYFLIGFMFFIYLIQVFISNKNPRYIIPITPIFFVYSGIGLISTYRIITHINKIDNLKVNIFRKSLGVFSCGLILFSCIIPLVSAIDMKYTPGMGFGKSLPFYECIQIIRSDGDEGIIMPDSQTNIFNTPTLSFYISSLDNAEQYSCTWPVSNASSLIGFNLEGKSLRYILVHNVTSDISRFIFQHPEAFNYLNEVKNENGIIIVFKVTV